MKWCQHLTWNDCGRWEYCDNVGTFLDHPMNKGFDGWKFCPICGAKRPEQKTLAEKIGEILEESHCALHSERINKIVSIVREHIGELYEDWKVHKGGMFQDVIRELK